MLYVHLGIPCNLFGSVLGHLFYPGWLGNLDGMILPRVHAKHTSDCVLGWMGGRLDIEDPRRGPIQEKRIFSEHFLPEIERAAQPVALFSMLSPFDGKSDRQRKNPGRSSSKG